MIADFKNIIAAFDGREGGKMAVEWGAKIKKTIPEASLTVVHVFNEKVEQRSVGNVRGYGYTNDGVLDATQIHPVLTAEQERADYQNETHAVVKNSSSLAQSNALSILRKHQAAGDFIILEGNPAASICRYAKDIGADLIIIGNSGKSGLKKLFLGSTTSTVAKEADCPVLIAK
jgi:nucleotide-binding universal stress UspA family protein